MGFPDFFLFDFTLPNTDSVLGAMTTLGRILLHLAALIGLLT